jgi:hypothetical protein
VKALERGRLPWAVLLVAFLVAFAAVDGFAQDPTQFWAKQKETGRTGWSYLTTVAAFVVGGGVLAAGARALFRGEWQMGLVGIGFGIAILIFLWGLGGLFGFNSPDPGAAGGH